LENEIYITCILQWQPQVKLNPYYPMTLILGISIIKRQWNRFIKEVDCLANKKILCKKPLTWKQDGLDLGSKRLVDYAFSKPFNKLKI
jgi:hypothetical protein